ncbi:kexin-like serine endoproteas, putative [Trichomonas vaginalis G3]|uniref:Kexin-like serine endoproteas, putative n=1 Tax=Trichomonas vaginalis (strain ATCC PRA-98 / G3) TaxID=412133 RepID=A2H2T5_TRIV3|nr:kexin-like serine endoproteas, putative [Trichomonas vaginalis G3]|eukprot:XP_001289212.1 kexin-like serine endoproteas [Trichomonas vaginalis G3]
MTDVPLPECLPKPEEPKAEEPQQSPQQPQFQQVPPPNYYQFPPQGYYPPQGFPNYPPPQPMPYFPNPWMFQQAPPQQFQSQSKRDQEFEEGLNRLRKEYATAPMEEDRLSLSSLKSTDSTRTTDSVRDREDYLKQSERLFILQPFTVGALKNMRNYEGQTPAGDRKTDVLTRAVQLVKTKTEIVDFILAACPYK